MYPWPGVEKLVSDFTHVDHSGTTVGCVLIEIGSDGFLVCWLLPVMGPPRKGRRVGSAAPLALSGYNSLHSPPDVIL